MVGLFIGNSNSFINFKLSEKIMTIIWNDIKNGFPLEKAEKIALTQASNYLEQHENRSAQNNEISDSILDKIKNSLFTETIRANTIGTLSSNTDERNAIELLTSRISAFALQFAGENAVKLLYGLKGDAAQKIAKMPPNIGEIIAIAVRKIYAEKFLSLIDGITQWIPKNSPLWAKLKFAAIAAPFQTILENAR